MNKRLKKIGIICIAVSMVILIVNLIYGNENIAVVGFDVAAVGYILISIGKTKEINKRRNEKYILDYEISELIYSYREMGKYIKDKDIPELEDIQVRIENELSDVAIRVKHREEWINKKGIKKKWQLLILKDLIRQKYYMLYITDHMYKVWEYCRQYQHIQ